MNIRSTDITLLNWTGDTVALGLFENQLTLSGEIAQLDQQWDHWLTEAISEEKFTGKAGTCFVTRTPKTGSLKKLIIVGLGTTEDYSLTIVRNTSACIARCAKKAKSQKLAISLPPVNNKPSDTIQAMSEGLLLALHEDNRFKSKIEEEQKLQLESIDLLGYNDSHPIETAKKIADGVILARELVNAPANYITPITLAETAQSIAQEYGLTLKILEQADCEALKMGSFLSVAQASDIPPKFVHLTYTPNSAPRKKVAIVGKGLTFDSGGLNIKGVGSGIETMKTDMGGAAATFGAAKAIAQLKPDVEVHFISAITENMISGKALHPGDIVTASNGKTIEVNNTDAEGRLTLADALVYAESLKVDAIVDLATLTGACVIALGEQIAGLWSNNADLANSLKSASTTTGEKLWEMPLEEKYFEGMKSSIADMKNTGPRYGGAITAALFLKEYITDTPWAHLDIAGPVWSDKEYNVNNAGATGFPVRTLVEWVLN